MRIGTGRLSLTRDTRRWSGSSLGLITSICPQQECLPSPLSLMACPQVVDYFHHDPTVNFVVVGYFLHERPLCHGNTFLLCLSIAAPHTHHGSEPINPTVGPVGFNKSVRMHGSGHRLQSKTQCPPRCNRFASHHSYLEVKPAQFRPIGTFSMPTSGGIVSPSQLCHLGVGPVENTW